MLDNVAVVARETVLQSGAVLNDFREVPIYLLQESPTNPRRSFDEAKLHELAQSIRSQGVLVPLTVRSLDIDRFEVVAGARRFRAARLAELASVPVRVVQLTDTQVLEYQLIENAIREDVHPYEEAMAYGINTDAAEEPDAAAFELRKRAQQATEPQLVRMLMELALLPSGWSDEVLEPSDLLASAARRYEVSLTEKNRPRAKAAKCAPKATSARSSKTSGKSSASTKTAKKAVRKGGAA